MATQFQDPSLERTFRGHKDTVTSVSFAPGGPMKQLVSSAVDGSLMLWNFKPQLRAFRFLGHRGPVYHAEFAPSGQLIASGELLLWAARATGQIGGAAATSTCCCGPNHLGRWRCNS